MEPSLLTKACSPHVEGGNVVVCLSDQLLSRTGVAILADNIDPVSKSMAVCSKCSKL